MLHGLNNFLYLLLYNWKDKCFFSETFKITYIVCSHAIAMRLTRVFTRGDLSWSYVYSRKRESRAFMNNLSSSPRRVPSLFHTARICVASILCIWARLLTKRSRTSTERQTKRPNDDDDYAALDDNFDSRSATSFPGLMSMSRAPIRKSTARHKEGLSQRAGRMSLYHPGR